ncbi:hypothetical protein GCM10020254_56140 [Streptomyces goshikiensis]
MDLFPRSWTALRTAVADLCDQDFEQPSGCAGWLVRDLVCHLVIDAQDVLITLATPVEAEPTVDAVSYWNVDDRPPTGQGPLDALTVRLAAAYGDPHLLRFHLDDVGSAAGRAAALADPGVRVGTRGEVLTVADYLDAYVPGVDAAPPRPDRAPARGGRAARRGYGPVPRDAGDHRGRRVPRVVHRHGRPAGRHGPQGPDRRGARPLSAHWPSACRSSSADRRATAEPSPRRCRAPATPPRVPRWPAGGG